MAWVYDSAHSGYRQNDGGGNVTSIVSPASVLATGIPTGAVVCVFGMIGDGSDDSPGVTDNASGGTNTYTRVTAILDPGSGNSNYWFICPNIHGSPTQLTMSWTGAHDFDRLLFDTFTGGPGVVPVAGAFASHNAAPGSIATDGDTSGNFTAQATNLVWGAVFVGAGANPLNAGTGFTRAQFPNGNNGSPAIASEYILSAAGGTTAATFTNSSIDTSDAGGFAVAPLIITVFSDAIGMFDGSLAARSGNERRRTIWSPG